MADIDIRNREPPRRLAYLPKAARSGSARCKPRGCQRSPCRIHTHARCHLDALRRRLGRARESAYSPGPCREWVGRSVAGRGPHFRHGWSRRSNSRRGAPCRWSQDATGGRSGAKAWLELLDPVLHPIGEPLGFVATPRSCEISACVAEHPPRYMGVRPQGLTLSGKTSTSLRTGPRLIRSGSGRSLSPNVTRLLRGKDRVNERADVIELLITDCV
jgi:hypothetical protein